MKVGSIPNYEIKFLSFYLTIFASDAFTFKLVLAQQQRFIMSYNCWKFGEENEPLS